MNEYNIDIGNRIKELRELSDVSTEELSEKLNLDKELYEKYESGQIDIPASVVYEISRIFQVDMGLLLTGEESQYLMLHVLVKACPLNEEKNTNTKTYVNVSSTRKRKCTL